MRADRNSTAATATATGQPGRRAARSEPEAPVFAPRPAATRRRRPSLIDVTLDPAQRAAVERPAGDALLVLGEAGHGKSTVALHRVAHVWRSSAEPMRAAVVVPSEGLARLMQPLLRRLGVDVEVLTYDRWAAARARRAFRRLPRESESTPPSVMRIKRSPALRAALEEIAAREPGRVDDDPDGRRRRGSSNVSWGDLQHLFGDRLLLERVARAGDIAPQAVADTLDRTRVQFSPTAEREWAHVTDRERLVAVDHRALDEGTAAANATTVDVEDYAVLFELDWLRASRSGTPPAKAQPYDLLMIDEAQELAPLELRLLGRCLRPGGSLVVAGDADQHTSETATFASWAEAMGDLGRPEYASVRLEVGYRCPPDVVALARGVLDSGGAPPAVPSAAPAPEQAVASFPTEAALGEWLARGLHGLLRSDRGISIAVICRQPTAARRLAERLRALEVPSRLVFDGRFLPRGPVQITLVGEVKGLEFDLVVVPDADGRTYPDDAAARRALYVAVTRARHQVVLACVGDRSPVIP